MTSGNNRIVRPDAISVQCTHQAGPMATPLTLVLNTPEGPRIIGFGGLTKLEFGSLLIAMSDLHSPERCVSSAAAVLAECERVQKGTTDATQQATNPNRLP